MQQKSMKKNAVLTMIKTLVSLFLPLITFPYISRVLQVEALGQYNFANSIVSYFILIAGLGIGTYGLREGAKVRNSRNDISKFASEMYVLNILSSIFAIILLVFISLFVSKLSSYSVLIFILGTQIIFITYGRSWIYSVYEDFEFITIVQLVFNAVMLVLLFVFVKSPNDIYLYAAITVVSSVGANVLYGVRLKKYVDFKKVKLADIKKHIKPVILIFGTSVATTIYVNSDMTILGWLADDRTVGLYSTSVKIYNIVKQVLVAVITVTIPRLTLYANTEKFKLLFKKVVGSLLTITLPATTGIIMISKDIVLIISSEEYLDAVVALQILSIALIFALLACLFGTCVLLPYLREKIFLMSTIVSALVNILLNFILIPVFYQNAAAFTTVLSQAIAFIICYIFSKKYIDLSGMFRTLVSIVIGCMAIVFVCDFLTQYTLTIYIDTFIKILASCSAYVVIQILLKNRYLTNALHDILHFVRKHKRLNRLQ